VLPVKLKQIMKYSEFHRKIKKNGWKYSHAEGSHYFYLKDGLVSQPIPFHGAKEMYEPLRKKIEKEMGLK
jgi:predicted RNA binding protein YcfA (HicA-like mRNA interferase family)